MNSTTFTAFGSVGYQRHDAAISIPLSGYAFVGTRNENIEFPEGQFLSVFFTECQRKHFGSLIKSSWYMGNFNRIA
jgi:hypothetical protein